MIRRQHALRLFLGATVILALGLVMSTPSMAVRGSYPGFNGKIVFNSPTASGTMQIFMMNPDGTGVTRLTYPPEVVDINYAAWSPDGSKITFTVDGNIGLTPGGIWVMKLDEPGWEDWIPIYTTGIMTMDVVEPAWSPDGSKIAFTKQNGPLVAVMPAVRNATPTDLAIGRKPHWSPDGTQIVLQRNGNIFVVDAGTGQDLRQLTGLDKQAPNGSNFEPCWSPDGSMIAFSSGAGIWVISAADGRILSKPTANPADIQPNWSPDGTKIIFARFCPAGNREAGPSSIWVMNADGSNPTELTPWGCDLVDGPRNPDWQSLTPQPQAVPLFGEWALLILLLGLITVGALKVSPRPL